MVPSSVMFSDYTSPLLVGFYVETIMWWQTRLKFHRIHVDFSQD